MTVDCINKVDTAGWNAYDYLQFLEKAVVSCDRKRILEAYDLIKESEIDFMDVSSFIADEYDWLVEQGNKILGY